MYLIYYGFDSSYGAVLESHFADIDLNLADEFAIGFASYLQNHSLGSVLNLVENPVHYLDLFLQPE